MKLLIKLSDLRYQQLKDGHETLNLLYVLADAVKRGKQLPENATNGDVIKAMFDDPAPKYFNLYYLDWWNAPYEGDKNGQDQ